MNFPGIEGKGDGVCPFAVKKVMKTSIGKINFRMCQLLLFVDFDTIEVQEFKVELLIKS